jgi:uncharacterized protein (DUF488 family)
MSQVVYSIGHSNGTIERLIGLLQQHSITAVADVRSQPYSRFNPQFNREVLAGSLKGVGLEYVFLGQELGARSDDPACYRNGRAQYALIAKAGTFQRGIERLLSGAERFRLAILCAEKEPLVCHRGILISRHLHEIGMVVRHILEDGSVEDHENAVERLLDMHGLRDEHLFHSREERIALAYQKQAEDIQYAREESQPA